ncbi:MAG: hypothetical protein NTU44_10245 [Bacteroidetes bacterium]|nr:hypothetical protein [Bacteroidota bacterium]
MKKQVKIIIGVVVVLAIAIAIASYYFPKPKGDETSGTIGKADKYRKDQMAAKDLLLRDDILKDTAAVRKTLTQLLEFSMYCVEFKKNIDSGWIAPVQKVCSSPECAKLIAPVKEYSDFMGNSMPLLKKTNEMLADCYYKSTKEMSMDVGMQLLEFVTFVDQFRKRDSVLDNAIISLDKLIKNSKELDKKRKDQLTVLKRIRDKMVYDNILLAVNTGDKKKYELCGSMPIFNVENIKNFVQGTTNLQVGYQAVTSYQNIVVSNAPNLQSFILSHPNVQSNVVFCAVNPSSIPVLSSGAVQNIPNTNVIVILSKDFVTAVASKPNLQVGYSNKNFESIVTNVSNLPNLSAALCVAVFNVKNLQGTVFNQNSVNLQNVLVQ